MTYLRETGTTFRFSVWSCVVLSWDTFSLLSVSCQDFFWNDIWTVFLLPFTQFSFVHLELLEWGLPCQIDCTRRGEGRWIHAFHNGIRAKANTSDQTGNLISLFAPIIPLGYTQIQMDICK